MIAEKLEIQDVNHFRNFLRGLNPEECTMVCDDLSGIIHNVSDFTNLLQPLTKEQRSVVYDAMRDRLPSMINTANDFANVLLCCLTREQHSVVYEAMRDRFPDIIKTALDFSNVLQPLTREQRVVVYEAMRGHLPQIIISAKEFGAVLKYLTSEECSLVYESMRGRLPNMIKTVRDFNNVLQVLNPEQCAAVYNAMRDRFPDMIKTAQDFDDVLRVLNPEQRAVVYDAMRDRLPDMIKTTQDFNNALRVLNPEQCAAVYDAMRDRLPDMIKTAQDFDDVLRVLNPEQRAVVYDAMRDRLPDMIHYPIDFSTVLRCLTIEQHSVVYEAIKHRLYNIIQNFWDFSHALQHLTTEQRAIMYEAMRDHLPDMIKNSDRHSQVTDYLTLEQVKEINFLRKRLALKSDDLDNGALWDSSDDEEEAGNDPKNNRSPFEIFIAKKEKSLDLGDIVKIEGKSYVFIHGKSDGQNSSRYDGTYVTKEAYDNQPERTKLSRSTYKFGDIFFLKKFPEGERQMEGFTELLAGNIISKMISEGFISPFYSDCFSPAKSVELPNNDGFSLWQMFIVDAVELFRIAYKHNEYKKNIFSRTFIGDGRETVNETMRRMWGEGYETYFYDINLPLHGPSFIMMMMLLFGNYSLHSGNVMFSFGQYDLCLMSECYENKLEPNKVYLDIINDQIMYRTNLTPDSSSILLSKYSFQENEQSYHEELYRAIQERNLVQLSKSCKKSLLDITSKRNHTLLKTKANFTVIDYGAAFRKYMETWSQEDILRSLEESETKIHGWIHKKYLDFYRTVSGFFQSVVQHAENFNQTLQNPQRKELLRSIITSSVEETYKSYKRMYKNDWTKTKTALFKYIYGKSYQDFYRYLLGISDTDHVGKGAACPDKKYNTRTMLAKAVADVFFERLQKIIAIPAENLPEMRNSHRYASLTPSLRTRLSFYLSDTKSACSNNEEKVSENKKIENFDDFDDSILDISVLK